MDTFFFIQDIIDAILKQLKKDMGPIPGKLISGPGASIFKLLLTPKLKKYLGERNLRNELFSFSNTYLDQSSYQSGANTIR